MLRSDTVKYFSFAGRRLVAVFSGCMDGLLALVLLSLGWRHDMLRSR